MALRPGRCYRKLHRPYTRQSRRKPKKGYVKGVPKPKITSFRMGEDGDYNTVVYLIAKKSVQIRHNALESARVAVVQFLERNIEKGSKFFFRIRIYPHHVIRENALATGAGADRFQQGMRQSFGKPIGTAARVKENQKLMEIKIDKKNIDVAKKAAYYLWDVHMQCIPPLSAELLLQNNTKKEGQSSPVCRVKSGLLRVSLNGKASVAGTQADYAYLAQAYIALFDATQEKIWLEGFQKSLLSDPLMWTWQ